MTKKTNLWHILHSTYLLNNNFMRVRVDQRNSSELGQHEYYLLEFPDWANVVAVTDEGQFVLIRQYRHGMDIVNLEIPGGVIDKGEEPRDAALRELLEETGYAAGEISLLRRVSVNPAIQDNWCHLFLATGCQRVRGQNLDPTEQITIDLVSQERLKELMADGEIHHSLNLLALTLALNTLSK